MARRLLIALFLTIILPFHVGAAHGFSLLSTEETGEACLTGPDPYTLLALNREEPPGAYSASSPGGQTYEVEPIFSVEFPKTLLRDLDRCGHLSREVGRKGLAHPWSRRRCRCCGLACGPRRPYTGAAYTEHVGHGCGQADPSVRGSVLLRCPGPFSRRR